MLIWNLYFLVKLFLWSQYLMTIAPSLNASLMILVIAVSVLTKDNVYLGRLSHLLIILPLAIALVLHEAGLVLSLALIQQIQNLTSFSQEYLLELFYRTFTPKLIAIVVACALLILVMSRYIRVSAWIFSALLLVSASQAYDQWKEEQQLAQGKIVETDQLPIREGDYPAERVALGDQGFLKLKTLLDKGDELGDSLPSQFLEKFYEEQLKLMVAQPRLLSAPNFDIIFIHVCSLAWADLRAAQQSTHPVITEADLILKDFNTVASYSGPAVIRLLRSQCGQKTHNDIYKPIQPNCSLFETLASHGFNVQLGLNHDGKFDDFKELILSNLVSSAKELVNYDEVTVGSVAFDGSTIADDREFLKTWWSRRLKQDDGAVALYYNSISLHDGNKLLDREGNSLKTYPIRAERLLDSIQEFITQIKKSNRRALVIMVPEHGAGISGEYGQLPGLREIPTPAITLAPTIVHWISPDYEREDIYKFPITIEEPTSFTALTEFINRWISLPPGTRRRPEWPAITADLPSTRFVAEQGDIVVLGSEDGYLLRTPGQQWRPLIKSKEDEPRPQ